jgi:hypothetical protein
MREVDLISAAVGCLAWIPVAFMIMSFVQWMIAGDVDFVTGIFGIFVGLGLGFVAMRPPIPILAPIALFVALCTVLAYPFVRLMLDRRDRKSFEVEELERAYALLGQQPRNPLAKFRIAKCVSVMGMPGPAYKVAESVMGDLPPELFVDEHRQFRNWQYQGLTPSDLKNVSCVECGHMNSPERTHCFECGHPHLLDRARGRVLPRNQSRRLMAAWMALIAVAVGLPTASAMQPIVAAVFVLTLIVITGFVVFSAFRDPGSQAAA